MGLLSILLNNDKKKQPEVKIIKDGCDEFEMTCTRCRCVFIYKLDDLSHYDYKSCYQTSEGINCPKCKHWCSHPLFFSAESTK